MNTDPEIAVRKLTSAEIANHLQGCLEGLIAHCVVERLHPAAVLGECLPPAITSRDGRHLAASLPTTMPTTLHQDLHQLVLGLAAHCDSLRADHEARTDATVEELWKAEPVSTTQLVIADKKTAEPAARITQRHCPATGEPEAVLEISDEFEGRRITSAELWLKDLATIVAHAKANGVAGLLAGSEGARHVATC